MKLKKPKPYPDLQSEVSLGFLFSDRADEISTARSPLIIGVDEVGRGCLAGPVVTAAAALDSRVWNLPFDRHTGERVDEESASKHLKAGNFNSNNALTLWRVRDSKLIAESERPQVRDAVKGFVAGFALGEASVGEIKDLNILYASHLAMERAVIALERKMGREADVVLVDGHLIPKKLRARGPGRALALVKGDQKSYTIACASIIAKTFRDDLMTSLDAEFPGYGLAKHKGYPTPYHKSQIKRLGVTPLHRAGFKGVIA